VIAMFPRDGLALLIQPARSDRVIGPVHVVLDVSSRVHTTSPAIDVLGDLDRTHDAVDFESPPEATAKQMIVTLPFPRQAAVAQRRLGHGSTPVFDPGPRTIFAQVDQGNSSAPRGMGEERSWYTASTCDSVRHGLVDVALTARNGAARCDALSSCPDESAVRGSRSGLVPLDVEAASPFLAAPMWSATTATAS